MEVYTDHEYVNNGRLRQVGPAFRVGCGDATKGRHHSVAVFECECGNRICVRQSCVRNLATDSCGCWRSEKARVMALTVSARQLNQTTHGMTGTGTYKSWTQMKARCGSPSHVEFERYGGRGIRVCSEWEESFEAFLRDMGERPSGRSLDRIDTNGNYEPANCRWADAKEQARNTSRNKRLAINGVTLCVAEWAEQPGAASDKNIYNRLYMGWSPRDAVFGRSNASV